MDGVIVDNKRIYTVVPPAFDKASLYGERIVRKGERTLRHWSPYRSKLAAALLLKLPIKLENKNSVLYLGAATGTTVSHLSDILQNGLVYAVEISPFSMKKLLEVCHKRKNILPILEDANHPEKYRSIVPVVDLVYQDLSQRNQVEIFIKNIDLYLKEEGQGVLVVKSRSIDVTRNPEQIYEDVMDRLREKYKIESYRDLSPYSKDHVCIIVKKET